MKCYAIADVIAVHENIVARNLDNTNDIDVLEEMIKSYIDKIDEVDDLSISRLELINMWFMKNEKLSWK